MVDDVLLPLFPSLQGGRVPASLPLGSRTASSGMPSSNPSLSQTKSGSSAINLAAPSGSGANSHTSSRDASPGNSPKAAAQPGESITAHSQATFADMLARTNHAPPLAPPILIITTDTAKKKVRPARGRGVACWCGGPPWHVVRLLCVSHVCRLCLLLLFRV